MNSLWENRVDGLILCTSRLDQEQLKLRLERFSFTVLINCLLETDMAGVCKINVDDENGARQAVDNLASAGHTHIAFIAGPDYLLSSQQRLVGYRSSLSTHQLPFREEFIRQCTPDTDGGYAAAVALLNKHPEITAIFAFNDLIAAGALRACADLNRHVPNDVAIIGWDDSSLTSLLTPTLSTLRIAKRELGATAMRILNQLMNGEQLVEDCHQIIKPELVLRQSTAVPSFSTSKPNPKDI